MVCTSAPACDSAGSFMLIGLSRATILGCVLAVSVAALLGGCGSGGGGNADTQAAIKKNWETFFNGSTPLNTRGLLVSDNGPFPSAGAAVCNAPLAQTATA